MADFTPLVQINSPQPAPPQPEPEPRSNFSDPAWQLQAWESLYYQFPSPGLKKRVEEVRQWIAEQGAK